MMARRLFLSLCLAVLAVAVAVGANDKPRKAQVYMFGFAASMTDSVCVMTELQPVEVYLLPNGFLADRALYSLQLNNHLMTAGQMGENLTCAVFFDKNKPKAEKRFQKVNKRYRTSSDLTLKLLGQDEFRFLPEEWVEPEVSTEGAEKAEGTEKAKAAEKTKGRKNKGKK